MVSGFKSGVFAFWTVRIYCSEIGKWRNKFNTTEKGEIEKKKAIKKE